MPHNPSRYQIVSFKAFANPEKKKNLNAVFLPDELLDQITWKNVATLKAYFAEYENERYIKYKTYVKKKQHQTKEWSHRDHAFFPTTKQSNAERRNDHKEEGSIIPLACSLTSTLTGKSTATISRYRNFPSKLISYNNPIIHFSDCSFGDYDLVDTLNEYKDLAIYRFVSPDLSESTRTTLTDRITYGRFFMGKQGILLRAAGERCGSIAIKRIRCRSGNTGGGTGSTGG